MRIRDWSSDVCSADLRPWSGTSFDQMSCDSVFVPGQAASWSMGHDDVAINDLEGLRQDTIRPIHILQPVRSGGRGHKMGADLRQQMARYLYAVHGCDGGSLLPAGNTANPGRKIGRARV